ncbi:hypothetical protein FAF44_04090 [Nonomuraea sp. MG754425]|uniref:DUF6745 domain-containing protein n=1 Tax=Nonomuraea sp. MG754425 TaxID=2570319 RepID=UPI001F232F28|nr:hypothetical protein [Nonomuraea sp. MG754425]MCF6467594.1 hypothetical protein [Nonomuraea sp. MG754425]
MSDYAQREAATLHERWLGRALSTLPADRPAAEAAISTLYHLIGRPPPRFHWVSSPLTALVTAPPGLGPRERGERVTEWPLPPRLIALRNELRHAIESKVRGLQLPIDQLIRREVYFPLLQILRQCLYPVLQQAHGWGVSWQHHWYETQSSGWIAHCEALREVAGVVFTDGQRRQFEAWAAAAVSCHWWWPGEHVCVVSERPVALRTEGDDGGDRRLHCSDGPAVRYADGWSLHSWHGTPVPDWVITDPTAERIANQGNVEVRRCAIENLGWARYIEQAGLRLLATAPDPGNPGVELRLYDMRRETRVLLAVNGSVERDGHRRRYGLTVPGFLTDPIAAAGWTYGLSAEQYSRLLRRT